MEFLKNLALPQSADHIELLHYLIILILILFIPFISAVFGGTLLSLYFKKREKKDYDANFRRFSKDIIELVTINKSVGLILGIVPVFTAMLIFIQLLQSGDSIYLEYFVVAFIFLSIALGSIYYYRLSLSAPNIIDEGAGKLGVILLFCALWFFMAGITALQYHGSWEPHGFISGMFSSLVLIKFLYFIVMSFAITGAAILFGFFHLDNFNQNPDDDYGKFVKKIGLRIAFTFTILLPVFMIVNLLIIPGTSLSGAVFIFLTFAIILVFIAYHFLYLLFLKVNSKYSALLFFTVLFSVLAIIISDQTVMVNSTKVESAKLSSEFEQYLKELKGEGGIAKISGEEIYKVRCTACHRFDVKLVGPPHNKVVPKYFGKEDQLISFILNPHKVDPSYPPMPNPGLKPNEAKAVADYVLEQVKKNIGQ